MTQGPTAATAALSAATVAPLVGGDPDQFIFVSSALAIGVGVTLLLAGPARLGVIAEFLSGPVLTGFVVGVAITIVVGQIDKVLEIEVQGEGFLRENMDLIANIPGANLTSLAMGVGAFVLLIVMHKIIPKVQPLSSWSLWRSCMRSRRPGGVVRASGRPLVLAMPRCQTGRQRR